MILKTASALCFPGSTLLMCTCTAVGWLWPCTEGAVGGTSSESQYGGGHSKACVKPRSVGFSKQSTRGKIKDLEENSSCTYYSEKLAYVVPFSHSTHGF